MAPDLAARVAIICVVSVFFCVRAVAQEGFNQQIFGLLEIARIE